MAKSPDPRIDSFDRGWNRELRIVAALVAIFILVGAVYTLTRGPRPTEGAGGVVAGVEGRVTESGALRPAEEAR
jgi:hypothetical protein